MVSLLESYWSDQDILEQHQYHVLYTGDGLYISQAELAARRSSHIITVCDIGFSAGISQLNYAHLHGVFDGDRFFIPLDEINMTYESVVDGMPILYLFTRMGTFGLVFSQDNKDRIATLRRLLTTA